MQENKIKLSDKLLSTKEVEKILRVNRQTISKYSKAGKLHPVRISERKLLFEASDVEAFLNRAKFGKQA